jgi:uncharacterized protein involved in exopolysaccharide biosynthesis
MSSQTANNASEDRPQENELNIGEAIKILWAYKQIVSIVLVISIVVSITYALLTPNIYKAEVLLAPVSTTGSSKGGLGSLAKGFGGLGSLVGIGLGGGQDKNVMAILESNTFISDIIKSKNLLPILFFKQYDKEKNEWLEDSKPANRTMWFGVQAFTKILNVSEDRVSGLITLSIEWTDPKLASELANEMVRRVNLKLQTEAISKSERNVRYLNAEVSKTNFSELRSSLFELIQEEMKTAMLANASDEYAVKVIDPATPPEEKYGPKRSIMVIVGTILGFIFASFIVFIRHSFYRPE